MKNNLVLAIEAFCSRNGMTLTQALKHLGIASSQYYYWKAGHRPQIATMGRIASALGVDAENLSDSYGDRGFQPGDNQSAPSEARRDEPGEGEYFVAVIPSQAYLLVGSTLEKMGVKFMRLPSLGNNASATGRYISDEAA